MYRLVNLLSALVRRFPVWILVGAILATVVLGAFSGRAEMAEGNEGFSPENEELLALEEIGERFSSSSESVMQVLVSTEDGDVISSQGLRAVQTVEEAVRSSEAAHALADTGQRSAIVSYLDPVTIALAADGPPPGSIDDAQVDELFQQGLAAAPPEQTEIVSRLVSDDATLEEAHAPAGLVLAFFDQAAFEGETPSDEFDALIAAQENVAERIRALDLPAGFEAQPFAFELLFSDDGSFTAEVQRLFGLAFVIILVILGFVYFVRPQGRMTWLRALRRTGADVVLTLLTIIMSIVWMQGVGVLLGPDYAGILGKFSPPTQIVPILLIGLGVDFAIHLNSRYREEIGDDRDPDASAATASRTVGIALVLATATTAVGFLTNITNPLPALKDFGILAAVGIVAAFTLMLTFVPSARLLLDRRAENGDRLPHEALGASTEGRLLPRLMARTSVLAQRFAVTTLVVTIGLAGLGGWGLTRLDTTFSFTDFVPQDSPALATFERIEDDFGGGFGETTNVLLEGELATPDAHNALVASVNDLADTEDVVTFGQFPAAESPVSVLASLVSTPEGQAAEAPPTPGDADDSGQGEAAPEGPGDQAQPPSTFDAEFARFAAENGLQPDLTMAAGGDVRAIYTRLLETAPDRAATVLDRDDDGFTGVVQIQTEAGEQGAADLARNIREDFDPLSRAGVEVTPTSNNIVSAVIVKELQDSQIISLVITLAAATLLLVVTFWVQARRPFLGVITAAPVVLVVLWTFGMMAATGISFNPITAVLSALAIGIGVPFTIHITHRFREDRMRFEHPGEAIASTVRHTGGALAGSALTTIAGFAVLITSSLVPFRQMGQVTAYAIAFAALAAILVLPSMLILWDAWHRRRGDAVIAPEPETEPTREPA